MSEKEQELLHRLLLNLFLESPKRTRLNPKDNEGEALKKVFIDASKTRKQPGGKRNVR